MKRVILVSFDEFYEKIEKANRNSFSKNSIAEAVEEMLEEKKSKKKLKQWEEKNGDSSPAG